MQSPNSELLKALYTQLTDSLPYPVYMYYTPNMVTPCVVLTQFDGGQDNHKECKGTNTTFLVECVKDYNTTLSLSEMFNFENEVVSYLTENRLTINNQNQVDIFWTNSIDQNENLQDGTLRVRRLLRFRILLQQNFETYIYKWLIGYDNGNFGFFNPAYGDLQPRNDYTALYLLDNKLIANNSTNTAPAISLDIKGYSNTVNLIGNTPNGDYSNDVDNILRDLIINNTGNYSQLNINNFTTSHAMKVGERGTSWIGWEGDTGELSPPSISDIPILYLVSRTSNNKIDVFFSVEQLLLDRVWVTSSVGKIGLSRDSSNGNLFSFVSSSFGNLFKDNVDRVIGLDISLGSDVTQTVVEFTYGGSYFGFDANFLVDNLNVKWFGAQATGTTTYLSIIGSFEVIDSVIVVLNGQVKEFSMRYGSGFYINDSNFRDLIVSLKGTSQTVTFIPQVAWTNIMTVGTDDVNYGYLKNGFGLMNPSDISGGEIGRLFVNQAGEFYIDIDGSWSSGVENVDIYVEGYGLVNLVKHTANDWFIANVGDGLRDYIQSLNDSEVRLKIVPKMSI